jgi:OPT family oligopeptide transporter
MSQPTKSNHPHGPEHLAVREEAEALADPSNESVTGASSGMPPAAPPPEAPVALRDAWWRAHLYRADREPQLTVRAVLVGGVIGVLSCAASLYSCLKLGWVFGLGLTVCMVSFVTFNGLRALSRGRIRALGLLENAAMSSVATVAGSTTGNTVVGAFGGLMLLTGNTVPWYHMAPMVFFAALMGTLIAVPLKRSIINDQQLRFPSSIAAAETLRSLYSSGVEATRRAWMLLTAMGSAALLSLCRNLGALADNFKAIGRPQEWLGSLSGIVTPQGEYWLGGRLNPLSWHGIEGRLVGVSLEPGVLFVGAGMIMGMRVALSMLAGALLLSFGIAPWLILQDQAHALDPTWIKTMKHVVVGGHSLWNPVSNWGIWCGTSIMVMSSLTVVALQWRTLGRAFTGIFARGGQAAARDVLADVEVPMRWFVIGLVPVALGVILTLWLAFHLAPWLGLLAVILSFAIGFICARSCGEADMNPIGAMGKVTQLCYAGLARGQGGINLLTAGVTSAAGGACGDLLSDMKCGYLLGQSPRQQFWGQVIGIFIGTCIVVPVWFLLVPDLKTLETYNPPTATMWKTVAVLLTAPKRMLADSAIVAMICGSFIGIVLPLLESFRPKWRPYLPSAIGFGLAFVLPNSFQNAFAFAAGAVLMWLWSRYQAASADRFAVPLASGLIAGEATAMALCSITGTALLMLHDAKLI